MHGLNICPVIVLTQAGCCHAGRGLGRDRRSGFLIIDACGKELTAPKNDFLALKVNNHTLFKLTTVAHRIELDLEGTCTFTLYGDVHTSSGYYIVESPHADCPDPLAVHPYPTTQQLATHFILSGHG